MVSNMSPHSAGHDKALRQRIRETHRRLSGLQRALGEVEAELNVFSEQHETFKLLEHACVSLEKLNSIGNDNLFWGDQQEGRTREHVQAVRERARSFLGKIGEMETRRAEIVGEMQQGRAVLDILEADLYEQQLLEEEKQSWWEVERDITPITRYARMPWSGGSEDSLLRRTMGWAVFVSVVLGIIVPLVQLPFPEIETVPEMPERFARLIEREIPPPPPVQEVIQPQPEPEPQPEPDIEPEPQPVLAEEVPEILPEAPVEPAPLGEESVAPREPERPAGILAFRDSLANISQPRVSERLGAQASINDAGESAVTRTERAMVASQAPGSSGGINLAAISRDVVGGGGAGSRDVGVSRVESSIGGTGTGDRPLAAGALGGRTDEEIQIVFDRYKASLYRLYNRELRNVPTLTGQMVLRLTIEPDGSVSFLELESSDMGAPALEQQILDRIRTFNFGAKEGISAVTIIYPIDFLPAA